MSALLLAPHNDDESLFAFHTLTREQAHVIVVLRSFKEASLGGPTYEVREAETECAMNVAGTSWEQWPYSDLEPDWVTIEARIRALAEEYDVLIAPAYEEGGHEHHNAVARIARGAVDEQEFLAYTSYVRGFGRTVTENEVVPTLFEREQKRIALGCYRSQIEYEPTRPWFGPDQREFLA